MSASFRKSLSFGPLHVNFCRSGVGFSAGVRGARVSIGPRGTYVTFGVRGFAYQHKLDSSPLVQAPPDGYVHDVVDRTQRTNLFKVYLWVAGVVLLITLLSSATAFVVLFVAAATAAFFVHRWDRERRTARIFYDVDNDEVVGRLALCNVAGEALSRTTMLWHVYSSTSARDRKYHAGAVTLVERTPTRCAVGALAGIELNIETWSVAIGPQNLLFLPDRLLVRAGSQFGWAPYEALTVEHEATSFVEDGYVPPDTRVVDTTWRFVNKSGGPDLRFNNNRQLPVVTYGKLLLRAPNGLHVVLQSSNPAATQQAAAAIQELIRIAQIPAPTAALHAATPPAPLPLQSTPHTPPAYRAPAPPPPVTRGVPVVLQLQPETPQPEPTVAIPPSAAPAAALHGAAPPAPIPPQPTLHTPRAYRTPEPPSPAPLAEPVGWPTATPRHPQGAAVPRRFYGVNDTVSVAGRTIARPLTFVASTTAGADASTIVTGLRVGEASRAMPLPYWPSYAGADPDQRARYLDWMAGGRVDREVAIGYVFIFFYGLEWRALRDGADVDVAVAEVQRLLQIYAEQRGSFRGYAGQFLTFAVLRSFASIEEASLERTLSGLCVESDAARAALLGWYAQRRRPLPSHHAFSVAATMEDAKRGVVVVRSRKELEDLFTARYREQYGDGMLLDAAKRPLVLDYHPASPTWLRASPKTSASVPNVLGRRTQFASVVSIWNQCVDELRKASSLKGRNAGVMSAQAWAALPPELRAQYDHPDRDRWDSAVSSAARLTDFHLFTAGDLAKVALVGTSEKVSAVQLRKIAETAAELGYAIEPEARVLRDSAILTDEILVWRSPDTSCPDPKLYATIYTMTALAMMVAMADGVLLDEEVQAVSTMVGNLFALDEGLRRRVAALQQLFARQHARATHLAKKLRATRTHEELAKVGRLLVAIAAADGVIADSEQQTLRSLYKAFGLSATDLASAIAQSGARLESDGVVEVRPAGPTTQGEKIPAPGSLQAKPVELDHAAVAAILADTRDVAAILAEVLDRDDEEPTSTAAPAPAPVAAAAVSAEVAAVAGRLDVRYHAVLEDLLGKSEWSKDEIRALAARRNLMPGAILETINAWSDDTFGDFLIDEGDQWHVRAELVRRQTV